ncbi:MAG: 6-phosphofructokinase [Phycisphaerae bacterium]|nr:6-phosphofructokinase [Phycisphaerae bacterium]
MNNKHLAILVGGGPAPGINAVIGAAAIGAINEGFEVHGILGGFSHLVTDSFDPAEHARPLYIPDVARIHFNGGSVLGTARASLLDDSKLSTSMMVAPDEKRLTAAIDNLLDMGITHLLTIGGDDTALSARFVSQWSAGKICVVHVPKTIDNDLPLPGDVLTFGYATARNLGAQLCANLMEDSRSTGRWYLVVTMGRNSGFLALGIGKAAGATLTLIPEEFHEHTTVSDIVDILEGAILKRRVMGRRDGVAVVAEGLAYKLGDVAELSRILGKDIPTDAAGHPRLSEVPLDEILKYELTKRFAERGDKVTIVSETMGYELRSAPPIPFDMAYCRDLGHGAIRLILEGVADKRPGVMVTLQDGNLVPMFFEDMADPQTNRTRIRTVDVNSYSYVVARSYMIRLEKGDFENVEQLEKLAAEAKMDPEAFSSRYGQVVTLGRYSAKAAMSTSNAD